MNIRRDRSGAEDAGGVAAAVKVGADHLAVAEAEGDVAGGVPGPREHERHASGSSGHPSDPSLSPTRTLPISLPLAVHR